MGLGLGISVDWASLVPYYAKVASAFAARVKAYGGTVENTACLKKDLKALNPIEPTGYLLTDYPGAAAAYSLRLINKTYAGSAIRVRRATDNAEQNIGFASKQLDTETLESFVNSGEAFTDPDITSSYNWTKGANTTYNAATEALDLLNENGLTARQGVSVSGHTYTITIVLDSVTSGGIKIYAGGTQSAVISTAGTHTLEITASNSNNILGINPSGAATCSISRFSAIDTTADAFVTTWYDQSGNGNNSTQTTAASQPQIVSSGTIYMLNSKPAISGNGLKQLDISTELNIPNDFFIATTLQYDAHTMILGSNTDTINFLFSASLTQYRARIAGFTGYFSQNALALNTQYNSNVFKVGNSVDHSRNGELNGVQTGFTGRTFKINTIMNGYISTNYALSGYAQEIIIWESDQSSNRADIETNINDFYSIY